MKGGANPQQAFSFYQQHIIIHHHQILLVNLEVVDGLVDGGIGLAFVVERFPDQSKENQINQSTN